MVFRFRIVSNIQNTHDQRVRFEDLWCDVDEIRHGPGLRLCTTNDSGPSMWSGMETALNVTIIRRLQHGQSTTLRLELQYVRQLLVSVYGLAFWACLPIRPNDRDGRRGVDTSIAPVLARRCWLLFMKRALPPSVLNLAPLCHAT